MTRVSVPPDVSKDAKRAEAKLGLPRPASLAEIQQTIDAMTSVADVKLFLAKMWVTVESLRPKEPG